jgi:Alanine dehydrogenase
MQIFFPKEEDHEIRATILPEVAQKFTDFGVEVLIESGLGKKIFVFNEQYVDAGATCLQKKKKRFWIS